MIEDDDSEVRPIPAVMRLESKKFQQNDLEALIEEAMMPVVQEDWREDKHSSSRANQNDQAENFDIYNQDSWIENGPKEEIKQVEKILSPSSPRKSEQPSSRKHLKKSPVLDSEDEKELARIIHQTIDTQQDHPSVSKLSFSADGQNQEQKPVSQKVNRAKTLKEPAHQYIDSYKALNEPIKNEWVDPHIEKPVLEETKHESTGEEDAILTTKHARKMRNKAKDLEPQPRRNTIANYQNKAYALEDILDQATKKNAHVRRQSRKDREKSKSPSPSPSPPKNDSPSRWKVMRRKQYEEPDLL